MTRATPSPAVADVLPIPMRLPCPACGVLHIDVGEFETKVHHTHSCQECGLTWRPAVVATVGVRFLPGFKNDEATPAVSPAPAVEPTLHKHHGECATCGEEIGEDHVRFVDYQTGIEWHVGCARPVPEIAGTSRPNEPEEGRTGDEARKSGDRKPVHGHGSPEQSGVQEAAPVGDRSVIGVASSPVPSLYLRLEIPAVLGCY